MTNQTLRWHYNVFNKRYFRNRLPHNIEIRFADMNDAKRNGQIHFEGDEPVRILISKRLQKMERLLLIVLLHEMVHASLPWNAQHGPRHDAAIDRLVEKGAYKGLL